VLQETTALPENSPNPSLGLSLLPGDPQIHPSSQSGLSWVFRRKLACGKGLTIVGGHPGKGWDLTLYNRNP
jgi:hypothetical protein